MNSGHGWEVMLKKIFYFSSGGHFDEWSRNICAICRVHYEEHFYEFYLEIMPMVQKVILLKDISISSSGSHFVKQNRAFFEILVECIMRNISVKF